MVFAAEPGRELVDEVRSDIGNTGVQPCQYRRGLATVVGFGQLHSLGQARFRIETRSDLCRLKLAAEAARADAKASQGRLERFRGLDSFTIGERRGGLDAEIDANDPVCLSAAVELLVPHLDLNRHEPAIRRAGNGSAKHLAFEAQGFAHPHPTDLGEADRLVCDRELVVGDVEAVAAAALLLELRRMRGFSGLEVGEELGPCLSKIGKGLGMGVTVNITEPRAAILVEPLRIAVLEGVELLLERHGVGFAACRVLLVPLSERPVPDTAGRAASALEIVGLRWRRTKGDLVG